MADISPEINAFKSSVYGEDVRDALVSLANKINAESSKASEDVNKTFVYRRNLTQSDDVNTLRTLNDMGVYRIKNSDGYPSNLPIETSGVLVVFYAGYIEQVYYTSNIYYRIGTSSTWHDWTEVPISTDIDNLNLNIADILEVDSEQNNRLNLLEKNCVNDNMLLSLDLFQSYENTAHIEGSLSDLEKLQICDSNGFSIGDFYDTAQNSLESPGTVYDSFSISDPQGNVVVEFNSGRTNTLSGKTVSIIGDSLSTFSGWMPDGYATYYPKASTTNDLTNVNNTWWMRLINQTGMRLIANCAWSGSKVTGDTSSTTSAAAASSDKRVADVAGPNNEAPDFIIVEICGNDFRKNVQLGTWTYDKEIPINDTTNNITDAYMLLIDKLHTAYPLAHVFCCTVFPLWLTSSASVQDNTYPIANSYYTWAEMNQRIRDIALAMNCEIIEFATCGLNMWSGNNSAYCGTDHLHPNSAGALLLANSAINAFEYHNSKNGA